MEPTQLVGRTYVVPAHTWNDRDVLIYALGVGAGQHDPYDERELAFTLEDPAGVPLVLPTFGVAVSHQVAELAYRELDLTKVVHAEQSLTWSGALPAAATVRIESTVTDVYDKGAGALMVSETVVSDTRTRVVRMRARTSVFVRDAGGFGGDRGPSEAWAVPERTPDHVLMADTRPDQALLYRLSGDRNPLHADPAFARAAGFDRPILHGLCTYGMSARLLLHAVCGSDPEALASLSARFSAPVVPGESLTVHAWVDHEDPEIVVFQTFGADGRVVLDRGRLTLRGASQPPCRGSLRG
ncbi:MaoC/PaaZ C-terminal domain-containing protein [Conexibacter sp. DBS9H8]|uniref:MaoC/PaaZ C-terminal domain-containing protein n=1 Tax=Conexibacter sp. DBS9H8 TaxID=2937801 RepID=UPI00201019D3|nr:MaoC/PaaZ C-terminal domain-containing protein [Conexibacter sp. DBS9H8]